MYTKPTLADLIEGCIISLNKDVMPDLQSAKAMVAVQVIQGVLVNVAQRAASEVPTLVTEYNEMRNTFADMAALLGESAGPEADRIRERARTFSALEAIEPLPPLEELVGNYQQMSQGLVDSVDDLDVLIREGNEAAQQALDRMRQHLGPRTLREFQANVAAAGMVGRG